MSGDELTLLKQSKNQMVEVSVKALVGNPLAAVLPAVEVDCLVDAGAVMPVLPSDVLSKLKVPVTGKAVVTLANEERAEIEVVGPVSLKIGDRKMHCDCLVGPMLSEPLVGQLVLESLDLIVDPQRRSLTPRPESPAYPSYKLK